MSDERDRCPQVAGLADWKGCPYPELYERMSQNICLLKKANTTGLVTGAPVCNQCPCDNSLVITSTLRDCDIVFPSILSPQKDIIYSRGNFYLLQ